MARRKTLSDAGVDALPTRATRYTFPDPELPCHYIRVTPTGAKSYVVVTNNKWTTIGSTSTFTIEQAREEARKIMHAVATGKAAPESFEAVTSRWLEQHVIKKQLRSLRNIDRHIKRLNAKFAGRDFASVRRAEIMNFVDGLIELHGECQADQALTTFGAISNWYALRNEDYASPIVRGMRVYAAAEHARSRILCDEEIRTLWAEQGPSPT